VFALGAAYAHVGFNAHEKIIHYWQNVVLTAVKTSA